MKRQFNVALKMAIFQSQKKQKTIARKTRISEAQLSHIIRGRRVATPDEQDRIAEALERPVHELFPVAS